MKLRVTFEVDKNELFDRIPRMNGDFSPLGGLLVGELLTSSTSSIDAVGMAIYGVTVISKEQVEIDIGKTA